MQGSQVGANMKESRDSLGVCVWNDWSGDRKVQKEYHARDGPCQTVLGANYAKTPGTQSSNRKW